MTWTITGRVRGIITFPDHPDHEGTWGVVGGEDATAERHTFRSPTEAARWCEKVLSGDLNPRWSAAGELLEPRTEPIWSTAEVTLTSTDYKEPDKTWTWTGEGWEESNG